MDREPAEARFCAECNRCHSAEEGDLWAESSMLGLRITYFACMDGKVYDITGERQLLSHISYIITTRCLYRQLHEELRSTLADSFFLIIIYLRVTCCDACVFQSGQVAKE